jgi:hypothetical protein
MSDESKPEASKPARAEEKPDILNGHTIPFIVFIALTSFFPSSTRVIYPLKTVLGAALLWYYRKDFTELKEWRFHWSAVPVGLAVLALWIGSESVFPSQGNGFNPFTGDSPFTSPATDWLMAAVRLGGSALVVPVLEELFWRSWLLRYLVNNDDFRTVPVGQFTWFSFLVSNVLFGLEHDRVIAGILAGIAYCALVYRFKEIRSAIVAHATTNFGLGVYVISTGAWQFW